LRSGTLYRRGGQNIHGISPPKQFLAGSDALTVVTPVLETRLQEMRTYEELSKPTDGTF